MRVNGGALASVVRDLPFSLKLAICSAERRCGVYGSRSAAGVSSCQQQRCEEKATEQQCPKDGAEQRWRIRTVSSWMGSPTEGTPV